MSDETPVTPATPDAVKTDKAATAKMLLLWGCVVTIAFVVVVFGAAFLFITVRGGNMPATDVFTTVIKTLGEVIVAVAGK